MTEKTYNEVARTRDHKTMMEHPEWWACMVLPMKRPRNGTLEESCYFRKEATGEHVLLIGNMFLLRRDTPTRTYASVEAILADGWIVD